MFRAKEDFSAVSSPISLRWVATTLAIALVYFVSARLGLMLAVEHTNATPIWPPSGIALGLILLLGYRIWPGLLIGALAIDLVQLHQIGMADNLVLLVAAVTSVGEILEAIIGAYVLKLLVGGKGTPRSLVQVSYFVLGGAIFPSVLSATIGASSLMIGTDASSGYGMVWFTWWLGDAVSILIITPFILSWPDYIKRQVNSRRLVELGLLVISVFFCTYLDIIWLMPPSLYILPVIIAAIRLGRFETSVISLITAAAMIYSIQMGYDIFTADTNFLDLYHLMLFMGVIAIVSIVLTTVIEERRHSEHVARSERDSFEELVCGSPVAMIVAKKSTGEVELINTRCRQLFGFSIADIPNIADWWSQSISDESERSEIIDWSTAKSNAHPNFSSVPEKKEITVNCKDSSRKLVEIRLSDIGERSIVILMDMTERKQAEHDLAIFRFALDRVSDAACLVNNEGRFVYVNEEFGRRLGYTKEQLLNFTVANIDPDFPAASWADHWQSMRESGSMVFEASHGTKDGRVIPVEVNANFFHYEGEEYLLGLARDITERKRHETELRRTNDMLEAIISAAPVSIFDLDLEGKVRSVWNPASEKMLGWSAEETIGQFLPSVMVDNTAEFRSLLHRIHEGHILDGVEVHRHKKDGSPIEYDIYAAPLHDSDGKVTGNISVLVDATERKRQEAALQASEAKLRTILENVGIGVAMISPDMKVMEMNRLMRRWFPGVDVAKLPTCYRAFNNPPREDVCDYCPTIQTLRDGKIHEATTSTPQGDTVLNFRVLSTPIFDAEGKVAAAIEMVEDVTERIRADEAMRSMGRELQMIYDNTYTMIAYLDRDFNFIRVNKSYADADQRSPEYFIGKNHFELYPHEENEAIFRKVVATGKPYTANAKPFEFPEHPEYGVTYWDWTLVPVFDEENQVTGLIFTLLDVTERQRAELARQKSDQKYKSLFEESLDCLLVTSPDGRILDINKTGVDLFGYSSIEDMHQLNMSRDIYVNPDERKEILQVVQSAGYGEFEILSKKKSGEQFVALCQIYATYDEDGNVSTYRGSLRDITEQKRLLNLESRAQRLETAGEIAGQVAHDLNNLLAPITAYPELIRDLLPPDNESHEFLDAISSAGHRIGEINQQLLTLSRRGHYVQDVINLNSVLEEGVRTFGEKSLQTACHVDLDPDLLNIVGGRSQLLRVFVNLLTNADDALADGGEITVRTENFYADESTVKFEQVPRGEYVKVTISDTGCGIPADVINRIFDPFFTTKEADRKRGSGLGLSVVNAVVKDHGGYIDLRSEPGKGTSFFLYFPITRRAADDSDREEDIRGGSESILVVDDDDIQRQVLEHLLSRLGYQVTQCNNGNRAAEIVKDERPDLIIVDMIMPEGPDGVKTYEKVLKINPEQRAIIVSGFSETDKVREAQQLGAGAFVKKPVNKQIIARVVREELDRIIRTDSQTPVA